MPNTGGLLSGAPSVIRGGPMLYDKPATTIDEQIDLLQTRGMVGDVALMRRWLETVGYYRLSAYWLPFETPPAAGSTRSKAFPPGTQFADIVDIYVFDRKLRLLVTEAVERVEIAIRSRWTHNMTLAHGSHAHLQRECFASGKDHIALLSQLCARVESSSEVFIEHYGKKYDDPFLPPLWMVTELMTLGELSRWFAATKDPKVKDAVAKDLGLPSRDVLDGTLQLLSYIRNICAHHGRLWNRHTVKRLPFIKRFKADLVVDTNGNQNQPSNQIYNALVALIHLMRRQSDDTTFPTRVAQLVLTRSEQQQRAMGFPPDWQQRPCWHT